MPVIKAENTRMEWSPERVCCKQAPYQENIVLTENTAIKLI